MSGKQDGLRHHFYDWWLRTGDRGAAVAAMERWQSGLRGHWPELVARLHLRCDEGQCTLMESYDLGAVLPAALIEHLRERGDAISVPWRQDVRQFEAFADAV